MLYWDGYEEISPFRGEDVSVYHDGWKQRMLDFDKRDKELAKDPDAKFDGEKFIHDNLNNKGAYSDKIDDNALSWTNPSGFGKDHWDYARITFGMKEKPLDHKKGTACDPAQSGPDAELCTPLCDIVLGCSPPLNGDVSFSHFAEGDNLDSKKGGSLGLLKNMNGWTEVKD